MLNRPDRENEKFNRIGELAEELGTHTKKALSRDLDKEAEEVVKKVEKKSLLKKGSDAAQAYWETNIEKDLQEWLAGTEPTQEQVAVGIIRHIKKLGDTSVNNFNDLKLALAAKISEESYKEFVSSGESQDYFTIIERRTQNLIDTVRQKLNLRLG
jgi:hypothetical protein